MGYYTDNINGEVSFNQTARNAYYEADLYHKDGRVDYLLKSIGFDCGRSRYWEEIVWKHKSGEGHILIAKDKDLEWDQDPYADPQSKCAFVHQQGYEIFLPDQGIRKAVKPNDDFTHWFDLPSEIRTLWRGDVLSNER